MQYVHPIILVVLWLQQLPVNWQRHVLLMHQVQLVHTILQEPNVFGIMMAQMINVLI